MVFEVFNFILLIGTVKYKICIPLNYYNNCPFAHRISNNTKLFQLEKKRANGEQIN